MRVVLSLLIGLLVGLALSEISFYFLRETQREPQRVELVIPPGTAERVARGETPPSIPEEMTFVLGDTLVVRNEDSVPHQLGPLWVPPGATASLQLDTAQNYVFACSFRPDNYLGLDVREPLTTGTRLIGILFAGLPLGALLAAYSAVVIGRKDEE
ncbi:MAG: hypothetical protein D6770_07230 [Anaerolineae bacterium]|nr:MAG: hypothetical protein D6770_07230 [Anaerolineae bacterium]